jgi:ceramide glucosyltransferase
VRDIYQAALILTAIAAVFGAIVAIAGAIVVRRFVGQPSRKPASLPAITILKPLYGDEALLEEALESMCRQAYPAFQIVFGVQDADDAALPVARRLQQRFPERDIVIVVNPAMHGRNRKISNLINMLPLARHDVLVFSDSDMLVAPAFLDRIALALEGPDVGLVTALCGGRPTAPGLPAVVGAMQLNLLFLPAVLLARQLGREDCLGTTMALRRDVLDRIGGLHALVGHLADDNVLGQRVAQLGLRIGLADTIPVASVPEASWRTLWQHEIRWARTIRALAPMAFAASCLQFPLFWAALACILSVGAVWSIVLFGGVWAVRAGVAHYVDGVTRTAQRPIRATLLGLLPVRDALSVLEIVASFSSRNVVWRGHAMRADNGLRRAAATRLAGGNWDVAGRKRA